MILPLTGKPALLRAAALGLALTLALPQAAALDEDQEQPLYLEADNAELDEAKKTSVYTGNVFVQQGSMKIHADQVTIYHEEDNRPERVIAVGNPATYEQEVEGEKKPVEAEALRMEYEASTDRILLFDRAIVRQGQDTFSNDRIVYDRATSKVTAGSSVEGSKRVRIHINPAER